MTRRASIVVVSLVIAGLVAVALMIVPSSPIHKKPTLGLDLQGGLEITKEAVPPKGRKLTKEDLSRSVTIMRDRVDRLGVSEPEIRTQGSNQITIQLPGVKDPEAAAKIIGKTAQLELFDLETSLVAPSIDINGNPQPRSSVYDLLAGQQAIVKDKSDQWWVFDKKKKLVVGPVSSKEKALAKYDGKLPDGYKLFGTPNGTVVISCGVQASRLPGCRNAHRELVLPLQVRPAGRAADDGRRPEALRHAPGLRHDDQPADRVARVHEQGQRPLPGDHALRVRARQAPQRAAALRDRARPRDSLVAADRLHRRRARRRHLGQRPDHGDRRHPGGEGSRARAPDRCAAGRVRDARPDRDLGHAR